MGEQLTSNIIEAIADSKGVEPNDWEFVLDEYIDIDAVEQLAKRDNSTWRLQFELPQHSVTVKSDGEVLVDRQLKRDWTSN